MKKWLLLLAVLGAQCANAQLLSGVSMQGAMTASTTSGHDVYTRGGSPRTGYYWYWRAVTLQTTSASVPLDFNASTGDVTTRGTWYSPNYIAMGSATVTYTNGVSQADWDIASTEYCSALPRLPAHEWCSDTASLTPRLYFSVAQDTRVTITFNGTGTPDWNIYALAGEIEPGTNNTYTLAAGGTYCFWATMTSHGAPLHPIIFGATGNAGPVQISFGAQLHFRPAG